MTSRHHTLITGTGRAGTTFLVELLTHLGLDTGWTVDTLPRGKDRLGRAGLEHDIREEHSPYVVKSPWFCDYAEEVLRRNDICIDHIFIPVRDLNAAAESRRFVSETGSEAGGLWHTSSGTPGVQETILLKQIYHLLFALSETHVPVTLLRYPLLTRDGPYLFQKLRPVLGNMELEYFLTTFNRVVRPELVHRFNTNDK